MDGEEGGKTFLVTGLGKPGRIFFFPQAFVIHSLAPKHAGWGTLLEKSRQAQELYLRKKA